MNALLITEYEIIEGESYAEKGHKVVLYTLLVEGYHRLLHPSSFYSPNTRLFNDSPAFKVKTRYRDLLNLHSDLQVYYPNVNFPEFPPKKWFGHTSERFICRRMNMLNAYFRKLLLIKGVKSSDCLLKAIQPYKSLDLMVVGEVKVGKAQFVKRFLHYHQMGGEVPAEFEAFVNHVSNYSVCSAQVADSSVFSEIEQFTPIDVIIDDWLVRINSIQIKNTPSQLSPADIQRMGSMLKYKDGILLAYGLDSKTSEESANQLYRNFSQFIPCARAKLKTTDTGSSSEQIEMSQFAYDTFTQFLREIVSK